MLEYNIAKLIPILSFRQLRLDVAPCPGGTGQVVKASKVHFPQPFLISDGSKELLQK